MSDSGAGEAGSIGWVDIAVENAEELRDFYARVVGWKPSAFDMGGYSDYIMAAPSSGSHVSGICHARGMNAGLPPVWLVHITVENLDESAARCVELGGKILLGPKSLEGQGRYCVMQDPAGAVAGLFEPARRDPAP
jgi:predicted enzyme related to lactoylglutathione lyase